MSTRRVLSKDELIGLSHKLLGLIDRRSQSVSIEYVTRAVTKIVNGRIRASDDGDRVKITFPSKIGSGIEVSVNTNQLDDTSLRHVISRAMSAAPKISYNVDDDPLGRYEETWLLYGAREFPPVSLWHESTFEAMDTARGDIIPQIIEKANSSGLMAAATIGLATRSVLYAYREGLTAFAQETDSEVTVTVRDLDGKSSGWAGDASRDWSKLSPVTTTNDAIDMAKRGRSPVALEPGRRIAILGPAAVAQLVVQMAPLFDGKKSIDGGYINSKSGMGTPFSIFNPRQEARHTKLGLRVFDSRVKFVSDPADPLGGFPPFFEAGGLEPFLHGYPVPATTWVERGILSNLAFNIGNARKRHLTPRDLPYSMHLMPELNVKTATTEDMIQNCEEGIYVNRFSNVSLIDQRSGMMTGVTQDGCFYVKNGKLERPIKNFRFTDSPFFSLNQIEMIGIPRRVALGYNSSSSDVVSPRWPSLPIIAPALMVRDFRFTSLADAV